MEHFKLNIETNHATLAGHTMQTTYVAVVPTQFIDANTGDELIGWDTDQFPRDITTTQIMLVVLQTGGFTTGGLNFDAKRRRESHEPVDLFHCHIGGMDAFARGLKIAHNIIEDGRLGDFVKARCSWDSELGQKIESGNASLAELETLALNKNIEDIPSGRQKC